MGWSFKIQNKYHKSKCSNQFQSVLNNLIQIRNG